MDALNLTHRFRGRGSLVASLSGISFLLFGITLAERDAFGISNYLATWIGEIYYFSVGILLIFYSIALFKFYLNKKIYDVRVRNLINLVNFINLYIFLGSFVKSFNLLASISIMLYDGMAILVIWGVIFFNKKNHVIYFVSFVFLQMLLSMLVLLNPSFSIIDGGVYQALRGSHVVEMESLNFLNSGATLVKSMVGKYGVFHNPNALGFYSFISICCACYLFLQSNYRCRVAALFFLSAGILGWLNSLTRGPVIFFMFGAALLIFRSTNKLSRHVRVSIGVFIIVLFFGAIILLPSQGVLDLFIPRGDDIAITARIDGYIDGFEMIENFPLFGVDRQISYWSNKYLPHFVSLYFASEHGIIAGIVISLIIFLYGYKSIHSALRLLDKAPEQKGQLYFCILLVCVCWGISVTNNITVPFLFWISFMEAQLLVSQARCQVPSVYRRA